MTATLVLIICLAVIFGVMFPGRKALSRRPSPRKREARQQVQQEESDDLL